MKKWILTSYLFLYLAGLIFLLWVTRRKRQWYTGAKGLLSCLFVFGGFLFHSLGQGRNPGGFVILEAALVFCALGDILLGLANRGQKVRTKPFLGGAVSFSLAHISFCILFMRAVSPALSDLILPVLLIFEMRILEITDKVRMEKMRPVGYIYVVLVGLMTSKALMVAVQSTLPNAFRILTGVGAVLFLVSDTVLLFLYFGTKRGKLARYVNLTTYYCSILLLAISAFWY